MPPSPQLLFTVTDVITASSHHPVMVWACLSRSRTLQLLWSSTAQQITVKDEGQDGPLPMTQLPFQPMTPTGPMTATTMTVMQDHNHIMMTKTKTRTMTIGD